MAQRWAMTMIVEARSGCVGAQMTEPAPTHGNDEYRALYRPISLSQLQSAEGVEFTSILSAGDAVPGWTTAQGLPWRFVGSPDGIGAFNNGDGTVTLLVNHEFGPNDGLLHAHGAPGSFDEIVLDPQTLAVVSAGDLAHHMFLYDTAKDAYVEQASALTRLCSGDLAAPAAYYDAESGLGTHARIHLNGEETTPEGRAFTWVATGPQAHNVYELPALGNFAIENLLASPFTGEKTMVIGNDNSTGGQLYVYVGDKQAAGSDIDKAGLTNGEVFGIKASFAAEAASGTPLSGDFTLAPLGDVKGMNGAELQTASEQAGTTGWLRPEDGAWDTIDHNRYYFTTTDGINAPSRLWALDFKDASRPELGGSFTALLDGTEGQKDARQPDRLRRRHGDPAGGRGQQSARRQGLALRSGHRPAHRDRPSRHGPVWR